MKYIVKKEGLGVPIGTEVMRNEEPNKIYPILTWKTSTPYSFTSLEISLALQLGILEEVKEITVCNHGGTYHDGICTRCERNTPKEIEELDMTALLYLSTNFQPLGNKINELVETVNLLTREANKK